MADAHSLAAAFLDFGRFDINAATAWLHVRRGERGGKIPETGHSSFTDVSTLRFALPVLL
jgi:hypothetical protein